MSGALSFCHLPGQSTIGYSSIPVIVSKFFKSSIRNLLLLSADSWRCGREKMSSIVPARLVQCSAEAMRQLP